MEQLIGTTKLVLVRGDLTLQRVDAIVNAANSQLAGGGGVDGAIHAAGGPAILEECRRVVAREGRLEPGRAVMTSGGKLPAKHVIHTVGPVWYGGASGEARILADAYRNALLLAESAGLASVAFPAISAGAFGYPLREAARVALTTIAAHLRAGSPLAEVRVVVYAAAALATWEEAFAELAG